jgi:ribosomal protein S18 acetylase RimI-like enzyme
VRVNVEIRPATHADAAQLGRIELASWDEKTSPDPAPSGEGPFFVSVPPADILVAASDDEPAGFVRLHFDDEPAHRHVVEVWGLSVAPQRMRQGIGTTLLHAALEEARRRGCTRMTLGVMATNNAARSLYEQFGFVTEGVQYGEYRSRRDGRPVDYVLMAMDVR